MNDLTLHLDAFWISPYSFSAYIALTEKNLSFKVREVALQKGENEDPAYRSQSITGRIPALQHGSFWCVESNAIIDYLEDAFPKSPRLLPENLQDRARARMILAWIRSSRDLLPLLEERPTTTMFYERAREPLSSQAKESAQKLLEVADLLVPGDKPDLFGAWCIADSDLAFILHRLILNNHEVPSKVRKYAEHQWARASVRDFVERPRAAYVPYL